jgi:hypothetical protein
MKKFVYAFFIACLSACEPNESETGGTAFMLVTWDYGMDKEACEPVPKRSVEENKQLLMIAGGACFHASVDNEGNQSIMCSVGAKTYSNSIYQTFDACMTHKRSWEENMAENGS